MMFKATKKTYEESPDVAQLFEYQSAIWHHLIGVAEVGIRFRNPFRRDKKPDCYLFDRGGRLVLVDYADKYSGKNEWHNSDCFDIIMKTMNLDLDRAIKYAFYDILGGRVPLRDTKDIPRMAPRSKRNFKITAKHTKNYDQVDYNFWCLHTDCNFEELEAQHSHKVEHYFYSNKSGNMIKIKPKSNTYIHYIRDKAKIYGPADRTFLTNFSNDSIGGKSDKKGSDLIIGKNLKSFMVVEKIGIDFRFVPAEGYELPADFLKQADANFDRIFFMNDNDKAGLMANDKYLEQWQACIGNDKAKAITVPIEMADMTYIDAFGNTKFVNDPYDYVNYYEDSGIYELDHLMMDLM